MPKDNKSQQLSVALVTRNRTDLLCRCLENLRAQSVQPYEVVISDDSDLLVFDANKEISRQYQCHHIQGPKRGLYANRNHVALACSGTHIRTMDDDHTFPKDHFAQCVEAINIDEKAVWTTGERTWLNGVLMSESACANQLHPSGVGSAPALMDNNWTIADGSTIYPKEIFDKGCRMVELFPFGSSYLEFGAYLYRHGYRSRCIANALVDHHADSNTFSRNRDIYVRQSCLFACICYNLYFRPNPALAIRYLVSNVFIHGPLFGLMKSLPSVYHLAKERWK